MAEYTNSGLAAYCKEALKVKTVYMWGGLFREVTENYIRQLSSMYPKQYGASRVAYLRSLTGKGYYGCDCIGLIKSYYFGGMGVKNNAPGYDGMKDYGVGGMYNAAKVKGRITTFPRRQGLLVMTSDFGHVGVYIGGDKVIECTLSKFGDGVVETNFYDRSWVYWCQCPFLIDDTDGSDHTDNRPNAKARENVNFRETPSIDGKKIRLLPKGTPVYLTGNRSVANGITWAECAVDGKTGWCDLQWLE